MALFSGWGSTCVFLIIRCTIKISIPNPNIIQGDSKTQVGLQWAGD